VRRQDRLHCINEPEADVPDEPRMTGRDEADHE
jgi:hypothetical protein